MITNGYFDASIILCILYQEYFKFNNDIISDDINISIMKISIISPLIMEETMKKYYSSYDNTTLSMIIPER